MHTEGVTMVKWEVGSTEDAVQALLERLVDPRLPYPTASINHHPPSINDHNSVARQIHAVVLLYNYYYRNKNQDLEFLDFVSFCKLAVSQRPCLTLFMKMTNEVETVASNVEEDRLSVTERAVQDACDITVALDASKDVPVFEDWQIWKVAVLLIDSTKEDCLLQYGAVTEGVWCLFERDLNCGMLDTDNVGMFQEIAFDAVKGVTGIDRSDLVVLENHVTYSLSKKNSAVKFYMMQYRKPFDTKKIVPLKFLVECLRGPLADKYLDGWTTTEFPDYHQMLPYIGFISNWLSRPICSDDHKVHNALIATESGTKESTQIKKDASSTSEPCKKLLMEGPDTDSPTLDPVQPRRSQRERRVPNRLKDFIS